MPLNIGGTNITSVGVEVLNDTTSITGSVLYLDAGIANSYPGSGTTWYDLSGFGNNVTLTNGPSFSTNNGGYITFDGTDDYADFYASNIGSIATVEMWCKIGSGYSGKMFMGWYYYDVWCAGGTIGYNTGNGDVYGISAATVSSLGCVDTWKQYIFEMRDDVSYTNNKIYINAVQQSLSQQFSSEAPGNRTLNSGYGRICQGRGYSGYEMPMNCAIFRVYNRALTASEVLQNFQSQRQRFGI